MVNFLPQETHLYPLLWSPNDRLKHIKEPEKLSNFIRTQLPAVNNGWSLEKEILYEWTTAIGKLKTCPSTTSELLRHSMHFWQEKTRGIVHTGEKTPAHIYYALKTLKEFPKCKLIVMSRDPRAAALSEIVKLKGNTRTDRKFEAFNFIVRWSTAVAMATKLSTNKKALFVKYEDLISFPEETLQRIGRFLDLDLSEGLLQDMLDVGVTNSSFSDAQQKGMGFNTMNLDRWKQELDSHTIGLIEYHLKNQMNDLNYDLTMTPTDSSRSVLLKQSVKLKLAHKVCAVTPAGFHHYNRNKKYRI